MSLMSVVFRILNKAGTDFIEPRSETGHGSAANKPTHTQAVLNGAQFQELKNSLSSLVIEGFALAENQLPDGHNVAVSNLSTIENILLEVTTPLDTQPVSADTLPLPTGAATADKQLPDNHQVVVSNQIQQPTRPTDTQPISVDELPLPAGAATEAKQLPDNHQVQVSNLPTDYPLPASQVSALTPQTNALTRNELDAAPVVVDTGLIQPTTPADTQPISAASLPLPTGAATEAKQLPDNHQVSVSNFPATQTVAGTVELGSATLTALESVSVQNTVNVQATDLDIRNLSSAQDSVSVAGTVSITGQPSTGTNTSVSGSTSQVTLLASNANRKGATIYNDSILNALKISLGATVTANNFTVVIASSGYYELPFGYTGIVTGIFNTATGAARITEVV